MSELIPAVLELDRKITAYGRGGVKEAAFGLGVSDSMIAHYRAGRRTPTPAIIEKIGTLNMTKPNAAALAPQPAPDAAAPDAPTHEPAAFEAEPDHDEVSKNFVPRDLDQLEAAVIGAETAQEWELVEEPRAPSRPSPEPVMAAGEWNATVWVPMHEFAGSFIGDTHGSALVQHCQSGIGNAASGAVQRASDRLGISDTLQNGHWLADVGLIIAYAMSCKSVLRGVEA